MYASFLYLKLFAYLRYIVPVKIFSKDIEKWPLFIGGFKKVSRNHKTRIVQWPTSFYSQISFFVLFFFGLVCMVMKTKVCLWQYFCTTSSLSWIFCLFENTRFRHLAFLYHARRLFYTFLNSCCLTEISI